jgi:hypothetical protein
MSLLIPISPKLLPTQSMPRTGRKP